jgi:hypothetical protein
VGGGSLSGLVVAIIIDDRNRLIREGGIGSTVLHSCSVVVDDGLHLNMKVAYHIIAIPSSHPNQSVQKACQWSHRRGENGR